MISKVDMLEDEEFMKMLENFNLKVDDFTCLFCMSNETCEFSFDPYNVNGDCLGMK